MSSSAARLPALTVLLIATTFVLLLIERAEAKPTRSRAAAFPYPSKSERFCGSKLTETLAELCQGRYPMLDDRRSQYIADQMNPGKVQVATLPDHFGLGYRFPSSTKAHRRVRRAGIYDECCKKSCTYADLTTYCE